HKRVVDRQERHALLCRRVGYGGGAEQEGNGIGRLLPIGGIERSADILTRLLSEPSVMILKTVEIFPLLRAIGDPIIDREAVVHRVVYTEAHVIKGEKVEPIRTRIVHLIFGVVALDPEGTGPLSEVHFQALSHRDYVRAISLKKLPVYCGARLVC